MGVLIFVLVLVIIVLIIAFAHKNSGSAEPQDFTPPPPVSRPVTKHFEKNHFINQHIHASDERHERHKRNQTPW